MIGKAALLAAAMAAFIAAPLAAPLKADDDGNRPAAVSAIYKCRAVAVDTARLACFDQASAELEEAEKSRKLMFGGEDDFPRFEGPELKSTIMAVRTNSVGRLVFTLPDGTRWLQTDRAETIFPPKPGDKFTLRRGIMGGYRATTRGAVMNVRQIG